MYSQPLFIQIKILHILNLYIYHEKFTQINTNPLFFFQTKQIGTPNTLQRSKQNLIYHNIDWKNLERLMR